MTHNRFYYLLETAYPLVRKRDRFEHLFRVEHLNPKQMIVFVPEVRPQAKSDTTIKCKKI